MQVLCKFNHLQQGCACVPFIFDSVQIQIKSGLYSTSKEKLMNDNQNPLSLCRKAPDKSNAFTVMPRFSSFCKSTRLHKKKKSKARYYHKHQSLQGFLRGKDRGEGGCQHFHRICRSVCTLESAKSVRGVVKKFALGLKMKMLSKDSFILSFSVRDQRMQGSDL